MIKLIKKIRNYLHARTRTHVCIYAFRTSVIITLLGVLKHVIMSTSHKPMPCKCFISCLADKNSTKHGSKHSVVLHIYLTSLKITFSINQTLNQHTFHWNSVHNIIVKRICTNYSITKDTPPALQICDLNIQQDKM